VNEDGTFRGTRCGCAARGRASPIPELEQAVRAPAITELTEAARELLIDTYQAVAAIMAKLGETDAAWIAADRAAFTVEMLNKVLRGGGPCPCRACRGRAAAQDPGGLQFVQDAPRFTGPSVVDQSGQRPGHPHDVAVRAGDALRGSSMLAYSRQLTTECDRGAVR
jgi:hypothetical protein